MVEYGADVNAKDVNGYTALHLAAYQGHTDAVRALVLAGADVSAKNVGEATALYYAAMEGHTDAVRALVVAGADASKKDSRKETPLDIALQYPRHAQVIEILRASPKCIKQL